MGKIWQHSLQHERLHGTSALGASVLQGVVKVNINNLLVSNGDMEICKTDMQKIIKYLDDAAKVYDTLPGQRNICLAWVIRQQIKKLQRKLFTFNQKDNEEIRHR